MNRDLRRSMQIKQHHQREIAPMDYQQMVQRQRIKKALDDGIWMGFKAASEIFEEAAKSVPGIGNKRILAMLEKVHERMEELKHATGRSKTNH